MLARDGASSPITPECVIGHFESRGGRVISQVIGDRRQFGPGFAQPGDGAGPISLLIRRYPQSSAARCASAGCATA